MRHFPKNVSLKLGEIAALVGGELTGDPDILITGVASIKDARPGDITFLSNSKYLPYLDQTQASAIIVSKEIKFSKKSIVSTSNPSNSFTQVISFFNPSSSKEKIGIHSSAVIDPSAKIGKDVCIGAHSVIEEGAVIGDGVVIDAQVFIGSYSVLGAKTHIYPQVVIREKSEIGTNVIIHSGTVIGSDGFGYETTDGVHIKIPQIGSVQIQDDVEIGSNVSVDRGRFQKTIIKKGTKIDNLVQIAHNVVVGEHSLILSQVGISGSSQVGDRAILAGQAGLVGHISLGDDVIVGAGAGVTKSWPDKSIILGSPAKPIGEQKKLFAFMNRLPELFKEFAEMKKKIQ